MQDGLVPSHRGVGYVLAVACSAEGTTGAGKPTGSAGQPRAVHDQIAEELVLSVLTVRTHIQRAMTELGARDRAQLVVIAYQSGLVRPTSTGF